jgi:hypothetical protein
MNTKIISLIVLLGMVGFGFYWFSIRPEQARKKCISLYPSAFMDSDDLGRAGRAHKAGYDACLRSHGLYR